MTSARCLPFIGVRFVGAPFAGTLFCGLLCRSAIADPSAACPAGWFCEPPPAAEVPPGASAAPPVHSTASGSAPHEPARAASTAQHAPDVTLPDMDTYEPEPVQSDRSFGVQARFVLPLIDDGDSPAHPFMAGPGLGFVFLPLDHIGLELAADAVFGRDALDARRRELAVSGALLAFFDTHPLLRVFASTGLVHSWAEVEPPGSYARHYRYFGAFLGLGAELTVQRLTTAFVRLDGFMRGRVDEGAKSDPEFVHSTTGDTSNSSAGVVLRVGAARYF